jgi:hypothetical protein
MLQRLLAPAATATLLYLTMTPAMSAETPDTMNAEQGWSAIARCAQEETERGRHTCLDRVLRDAGLLTPEMHAQQQRRAFGLDDKPARAPTPPAPAPEAVAKPPVRAAAATPPAKATSPAQSDVLEVELTKVEKAADGMLIVSTKEGAVWLQAESVQMPQPPLAGDHMTIRKGSLGGYRCSVVSTHLTYRCTRNR